MLKKIIKKVAQNKVISNLGVGEKVMLSSNSTRLIFLSSNFVLAGKIKRGLESFGKKVEIISNARENDDEKDKNLLPFIQNLNKYLSGELDALIFLPCSAIIKFDLDRLKPISVKKVKQLNLMKLFQNLLFWVTREQDLLKVVVSLHSEEIY